MKMKNNQAFKNILYISAEYLLDLHSIETNHSIEDVYFIISRILANYNSDPKSCDALCVQSLNDWIEMYNLFISLVN